MARTVRLGSQQIPFPGGALGAMDGVLHPRVSFDELRARFDRDGYLLVRGVVPRDEVLAALEAWQGGAGPDEDDWRA